MTTTFRDLTLLVLLLFSALIAPVNAVPSQVKNQALPPERLERHHLPDVGSSQLPDLEVIRPSTTTELILHRHCSRPLQNSVQYLEKRLQRGPRPVLNPLFQGFVFETVIYIGYRGCCILGSALGIESNPLLRLFENMYTAIRNAALEVWAKLPEQSIVHVAFGKLLFIILPPADRTIPWTLVEEVAHLLLLMTSAGMCFGMAGWYPTRVMNGVVWFYIMVTSPGTARRDLYPAGGSMGTDSQWNVWVIH